MTGCPSWYLRYTRSTPCMPSSRTLKSNTKWFSFRILATSTFSFDTGMSTQRCPVAAEFRSRVSMSAMGSVIMWLSSPARLADPGDLSLQGHLTEADPAQAELADEGARPAAAAATIVASHLELRLALGLLDQALLGHACLSLLVRRCYGGPLRGTMLCYAADYAAAAPMMTGVSPRNGKPISRSSAKAS